MNTLSSTLWGYVVSALRKMGYTVSGPDSDSPLSPFSQESAVSGMEQLCTCINVLALEKVLNCIEPKDNEKKYVWYNMCPVPRPSAAAQDQDSDTFAPQQQVSVPVIFSIRRMKNTVFVLHNDEMSPQIPLERIFSLRKELKLECIDFVMKKVETPVIDLVQAFKEYDCGAGVSDYIELVSKNGLKV